MQPDADISLYKKELRKRMLAKRRALSVINTKTKNGEFFSKYIKELDIYKKSSKILAYLAMEGEPDLDEFIRYALIDGKSVYVPVCVDKQNMFAARINSFEDLEIGMYDIRTLSYPYEIAKPDEIDLVLIPSVACDLRGNRLGMGKGYYDRYLTEIPYKKRIAVIWSFQIIHNVPIDKFDRKVSKIITEKGEIL